MSYVDDRYKNNPTVSDRYYSSNFRDTASLKPIDGESMRIYVERLARRIRENEEHAQSHLKWYTHTSAGPCWICDLCQDLNGIYDILLQSTEEIKQFREQTFPIHKETQSTNKYKKKRGLR